MRSLYLLAAICCIAISVQASPLSRTVVGGNEAKKGEEVAKVGEARQGPASAEAPAAPADDDDDDDDEDDDEDDDGDIEDALGGDDDDDDDDDDEEGDDDDDEEEDDDYLERFFDDILGEDEDDDDDSGSEPAAIQPVIAPADAVAAAPAPVSSAVTAVLDDSANSAEEDLDANDAGVDGDELGDEQNDVDSSEGSDREPAASSAEVVQQQAVQPVITVPAVSADDDDEDDDDDDEGDDIDEALDDEEDEDDEDEEDDEDDDDDDLIGDDLGRTGDARLPHSRALKGDELLNQVNRVPAIYIAKYNRFVDNILERMNKILRRSYDPVSVKLQPVDAKKKTKGKPSGNGTKKSNKRKTSSRRKHSQRRNKAMKIAETAGKINSSLSPIENETLKQQKLTQMTEVNKKTELAPAIKLKDSPSNRETVQVKSDKKKKKKNKRGKGKGKKTSNKKKNDGKSKPKARGTLYGLSTLRRTGDVAVNIMADHTTVKTDFMVGPLILKVEKEFGRGAKKELKSATATTAEMVGKLNLRIDNSGIATLHSIRVLQPKQVRVDSRDNHDRTREFVWRRSSRIAHVVSEKLKNASKPMFEVTHQ